MSHEVIIIHNGTGPGGEVRSEVSYKPTHSLSDEEQFKRLKHANKVLDKLSDYLYAASGTPAPDED
jgi:hypothetical protein